MKKLLLSLVASWLFINVNAGDVPEVVSKVFAKRFAQAEKVKWTQEDGKYEAEFSLKGTTMSATFSAEGNWLETETGIAVKDLPKAVTDYVAKNHPAAKIKEAAKIERPSLDAILYEAEIKENGKETDLILNQNGVLVK